MKRTMAAAGLLVLAACDMAEVKTSVRAEGPQVVADNAVEAGRYLVQIGGCNDCHTPGYIQGGGKTPEAEWLKGNTHGFFGPWGTTYAQNLRLTTANMSEDAWVEMLNTREALPIMPWPSVKAMHDADKRAIYRYIRSLPGEPGTAVPTALPPGQIPSTPYEDLTTRTPGGAAAD